MGYVPLGSARAGEHSPMVKGARRGVGQSHVGRGPRAPPGLCSPHQRAAGCRTQFASAVASTPPAPKVFGEEGKVFKGLTKPPDLTSPFPQGAPDTQLLPVALPCPPRSACPQDPCPSLTDRPQPRQPGSGEELGWLRAAEQQEPGLERTFLEILKEAATTGGAEPGPHCLLEPGGTAGGAAMLPPAPLWAQSAPSSPGKRDAKQRAAWCWKTPVNPRIYINSRQRLHLEALQIPSPALQPSEHIPQGHPVQVSLRPRQTAGSSPGTSTPIQSHIPRPDTLQRSLAARRHRMAPPPASSITAPHMVPPSWRGHKGHDSGHPKPPAPVSAMD